MGKMVTQIKMKKTIIYCDMCGKSGKEMREISINGLTNEICGGCFDIITTFYWRKDNAREKVIYNTPVL